MSFWFIKSILISTKTGDNAEILFPYFKNICSCCHESKPISEKIMNKNLGKKIVKDEQFTLIKRIEIFALIRVSL